MSIFISFSGTAREEFAIKFLNFFNKYGVSCWYDQHELFLGDNLKNTIITKGVETANYCILIINHTFLNRAWPCEEAERLYRRLESKKENAIFPILLDISKEEVQNSNLHFLLNIKYQFLHTGEEIDPIGLQILNRIFHDMILSAKFQTLSHAQFYYKRLTLSNSVSLYNALDSLANFDNTDYKNKTIFLICLIKLLNNNPYEKAINKLSILIYEQQTISFDMYKITESLFLMSASIFAS